MATLIYNDGTSTKTINVVLSEGVEINDIDESEEWEFTGIDNKPSTTVTEFVGGRPDDR